MKQSLSPLLLFIAATAFAAGHDLAPAVYDASAFGAVNPQIAWNGSKYLAIWQTNSAIFGAFIGADGTLLNATPIAFPDIVGSAGGSMRLAAFGNDFLVLLPGLPPHTAIIHSDGTASVDSLNFGVSQFGEIELAVNGTDIAVLDRYMLTAYFFSSSGALKRSVALGDAYVASAAIVAWRAGFLAATAELDGLTIRRFDRDGNSIAADERIPFVPGTFPRDVRIASSGEEALVAWTEHDRTLTYHFRAARLADRAKVIDLPGSPTSAAWTGSAFLVATSAGLVRVSREGSVIDTTPFSGGDIQAIAGHDGLAYAISSFCCAPLNGISIVAAAAVNTSAPVVLVRAPRAQSRPLIASNGVDFLALWTESTYARSDVDAVRLDRAGLPLSAPATPAAQSATKSRGLAFSGSTHLAIYWNYTNLLAQRFSATGTPLDAAPFVVRYGSIYSASVAPAPRGFLAAWTDDQGLWAALIGEDGTVGEPKPIPFARYPVTNVAAAFDGKQFLFLTAIGFPGIIDPIPPESYEIDAIRLKADLAPIDSTPLVLERAARNMSIASNGDGFFVVLDRYDERDVIAMHVNDARVVDSTTTVLEWDVAPISSVTWDGRDYVIATHHGRWLSINRVDSHNVVKPGRAIGIDSPYFEVPSVAGIPFGDAIVVMSEYPGRVDSVRARSYAESELPLAPAAPPVPLITGFTRSRINDLTLSWSTAAVDIDTFAIEVTYDYQSWYTVASVPGTARTKTLTSFYGKALRIRSVRGPRASDASVLVDLQPRRRAVR